MRQVELAERNIRIHEARQFLAFQRIDGNFAEAEFLLFIF